MRPGIQTFTGRTFNALNPSQDSICIEDIAHALSMLCRFTGHSNRFYSVAEHSIHVSRLLPPGLRSLGLFHDASEAYWADIASPFKCGPAFSEYRHIESKLQYAIESRFGFMDTAETHHVVKYADSLMLHVEVLQLFPPGSLIDNWDKDQIENARQFIKDNNFKLACYGPREAEQIFLDEFEKLSK